jgi:GGDEF domain-containing protein
MAKDGARDEGTSLLAALEVEIELTEREGEPLTLMVATVEGLGRSSISLQGDPLARVLQVAAGVLREGDRSLRRGPSGFAVLLPGADRFAAAMICQRISGIVRAAMRELAGAEVIMDFGLAEHVPQSSAAAMVSAADAELDGARAAHAA